MREQSNRQPSVRFLTAQSLFLEVNAKRDQRLQSFQAKPQHDKSYALQLSQELEADISFYCEAQREVDRLLDLIQELKLKLVLLQTEIKLERSIVSDFTKSRQLDLELTEFFIEQLKPRLNGQTSMAA
ncbi:hypothetical protein GCM10027443_22890 [Pontibacter brevis]